MESLQELLVDQLKDLYSAENQLIKALPRLAKKAESETLSQAISDHLEETKVQAGRLEEIAKLMEIKVGGKKCKAMEGLVEEGKEVLEESGQSAVIDTALIGASQRVEHYEMAAYISAKTIAEQLGLSSVAALLDESLQEEIAADEKLTAICGEEIIPAALSAEEEVEQ